MSDTHNDDPQRKISPEEVFKLTKSDAAHSGVKTALGVLPFGGIAAELFAVFFAAPSAKRLEIFMTLLYEDVQRLKEKYQDFDLENIAENEVFHTAFIQAAQAAIRTHSKEKHEALRNVVLNSAISKSPDENRQAVFIRLCDELTETHIHLLKFFDQELSPSIDLDYSGWRMNIALSELGSRIEKNYPYLRGQFEFYIEVINDLYRKGLIANKLPAKGMATRISEHPTSTAFAQEFLAFLKSPLD